MAQIHVPRPRAADPWRDFDRLHQEMDQLFHRFGGQGARTGAVRGVFPPVNLYETEDAYVLTAELPGVPPGEIQLALEGSTVTLQGERRIEYGEEDSLHRRERQSGRFRRSFELPAAIDAEKVEAVHRNGVLMLNLPKSPEARPRQISVQAG